VDWIHMAQDKDQLKVNISMLFFFHGLYTGILQYQTI
jgi:hypothetical protein